MLENQHLRRSKKGTSGKGRKCKACAAIAVDLKLRRIDYHFDLSLCWGRIAGLRARPRWFLPPRARVWPGSSRLAPKLSRQPIQAVQVVLQSRFGVLVAMVENTDGPAPAAIQNHPQQP